MNASPLFVLQYKQFSHFIECPITIASVSVKIYEKEATGTVSFSNSNINPIALIDKMTSSDSDGGYYGYFEPPLIGSDSLSDKEVKKYYTAKSHTFPKVKHVTLILKDEGPLSSEMREKLLNIVKRTIFGFFPKAKKNTHFREAVRENFSAEEPLDIRRELSVQETKEP